jgi:hypothetical protein
MWRFIQQVSTLVLARQAARRRRAALDRAAASQPWDGCRVELAQYDSVQLGTTPQGTIVFAALNVSTLPDAGELAFSSGGGPPTFVELPALSGPPVLVAGDYGGKDLRITNTASAPFEVEVFAPGFGTPAALPTGAAQGLLPWAARATRAATSYQQLVLSSPGQLTTFLFYAGASVTACSVNAGSAPPPVTGIDNRWTSNSSSKLVDDWKGAELYVANVSAMTATQAQVALVDL